MKRKQVLSILVIGVFVLGMTGNAQQTSGQSEFVSTNFDIWFYTQVGSTLREGLGLYLKQAVAPLGIDLKVIAKPWGQFVGDLLHISTGTPFDIAVVSFIGFTPTVEFGWQYHSECAKTSFGCDMYQLDDTTWQDWQLADTGVDHADVDALLDDLDFELDITKRKALTDEFVQLYMEKLLYDYPSISSDTRVTIWKGYGGDDNQLYVADEGVVESSKFGAYWNPNPSERISGAHDLRFYTSPYNARNFDPNQVFDTATGLLSDYTFETLTERDKDFFRHPQIAYNWFLEDWTVDAADVGSAQDEKWYIDFDDYQGNVSIAGNLTFFMRDDVTWSSSFDTGEGWDNSGPEGIVDAWDFAFGLDIMKMTTINANGKDNYVHTVGWQIHDPFTISFFVEPGWATPDDDAAYGGIFPLPEHVLNQSLTTSTKVGFPVELDAAGINPQSSEEWTLWNSDQEATFSVGRYVVDNRPKAFIDGETFSFISRDIAGASGYATPPGDYWFPNEDYTVAHPIVYNGSSTTDFSPHRADQPPSMIGQKSNDPSIAIPPSVVLIPS